MKKLKKFFAITFFIIITLFLVAFVTKSIMQIFMPVSQADVGSFEDYGGGSDWGSSSWDSGSSSWDSGSSWSSSSWDRDDYSYSSGSGGGIYIFGGGFGPIIFLIIVAIICIYISKSSKTVPKRPYNYGYNNNTQNRIIQNIEQLEANQNQIANKIQANDPNFNKEEFVAWSKNLFVKLQQAWTARDWSTIRAFETENLFEQHKNQLQGYINNKQINVMDRICVNYAHLYKYTVEGDKEVLIVRLNSRMADYIIDENTKEVIKGDKHTERLNTYLLTFIRKNGVKTKEGTIEINTTNCPNCGAPTQITSSGKCEYCGSVITTGEYNWVLSNLERENARL